MRDSTDKTEQLNRWAKAAPVKLNPVHQRALDNFDKLPDSAGVPVQVAGAVMTVSDGTIWRRMKDGTLDAIRFGGTTRVTVGSIRRAMAGSKPPRMEAVTAASVNAREAKKTASLASAVA